MAKSSLTFSIASLVPRRNRDKPGCDEYDVSDPGLTGDAGTYGCLALDNLYNVMHETDGDYFTSS